MGKTVINNRLVEMTQSYMGTSIDFEKELNSAAKSGNNEKIIELFKHDISQISNSERVLINAAYLAAHEGKIKAIELLLKNGAPLLGKNPDNKTYLFAAVDGMRFEMVVFLLALNQKGAHIDVDAKNNEGNTALEVATNKYLRLVEGGKPGKAKENDEHLKALEKIIASLANKGANLANACRISKDCCRNHFLQFMLGLAAERIMQQEAVPQKQVKMDKNASNSPASLVAQSLPSAIKTTLQSDAEDPLKDLVIIEECLEDNFEIVENGHDHTAKSNAEPPQLVV